MPGAKGNLVHLEAARTQAIELLASSYAGGLFEIEEYERRVELAQSAETVAALEELTRDVRTDDTALVPAAADTTALAVAAPESGNVLSVFGGTSRKGAWVVPRKLKVWSIFGGSDIDFREAQLAPGVTEVKLFAVMGGTDVIVPPGMHVQVDGQGIMGGFDDNTGTPTPMDPNKPSLRITGVAIMGGIGVTERYPGESGRQARKRRKKERRLREKELRNELEGRVRGDRNQLEPPE